MTIRAVLPAAVVATAAFTTALVAAPERAAACGSEPFYGEICLFGSSYCPRGFVEAQGQLLQIAQFQPLFALYGTMYGGDGRATFGLPDLRGRTPLNMAQPAGLPPSQAGHAASPTEVTMRYCVAIQGIWPSRD